MFSIFIIAFICCSPKEDNKKVFITIEGSSYFSSTHARPLDAYFDGEILTVLTNENLILEFNDFGEELNSYKVGEVVKNGQGVPVMFPGGQVVKFWKSDSEIIFFNEVPFKFLLVDKMFRTKKSFNIYEHPDINQMRPVYTYGKRESKFLIGYFGENRQNFKIGRYCFLTNSLEELHSIKSDKELSFVRAGIFEEDDLFFFDNDKSAFTVVDSYGKKDIFIKFNRLKNKSIAGFRLIELWEKYGFSKELRILKSVHVEDSFLSIVRLNSREIDGIEEDEYFLLKVNENEVLIKAVDSVLSITLDETGLFKVFSNSNGQVIFEQKSFEKF